MRNITKEISLLSSRKARRKVWGNEVSLLHFFLWEEMEEMILEIFPKKLKTRREL